MESRSSECGLPDRRSACVGSSKGMVMRSRQARPAGWFDTAKSDERITPSLLRSHPRAKVIVDMHLEVTVDFSRKLSLTPLAGEQPG